MKQNTTSIFLFHRDLRLDDNTGLREATTHSHTVIPLFICDTRQLHHNAYASTHAIQFMAESLLDLEKQFHIHHKGSLYYAEGISHDVIDTICKQIHIDAVYSNYDYTPFARQRDDHIAKTLHTHNIPFFQYHDALLTTPDDVQTGQQTPYTIFTPFYKKASTLPIKKPIPYHHTGEWYTTPIKHTTHTLPIPHGTSLALYPGGRHAGLQLLKQLHLNKNYTQTRDIPCLDATSKLSPHHKFGTISIRETYYEAKETIPKTNYIQELYWRDFFSHISYHFPHVYNTSFKKEYAHIHWSQNKHLFTAWCEGKTGFPIVDAGMRELIATGFMHNRVRMITASFLIKDLHINWQWGEQFFATHLVDYDRAINNGNWQWVASTGSDAQPYFRIFNPWLQQKKFDPDALYIKKWIPELQPYSAKEIHTHETIHLPQYIIPICDHKQAVQKTKQLYAVT